VAKQTTQGKTHSKIKIMMYSTLFLYPKERQFIMIGPRLQETQPGYNKGQDTIAPDWRGDRQIEGSEVF